MNDLSRRLRRVVDEPHDRFGLLLVLLVVSFIATAPEAEGWIRFSLGMLNLGSLVVAFMSTGLHSHFATRGSLVVTGAVGSVLIWTYRPQDAEGAVGATAQVIVLSAVTLAVLNRVLSHKRVTHQTLLGAISAYFLIGQVFAWIYMALPGYVDESVLEPAQTGEIPMYYSYVVLTTLGFGDITPIGALAQRITVMEALIGQLFLAILVARLVAMHSRPELAANTSETLDGDRQ